jgi:hypothetical protein
MAKIPPAKSLMMDGKQEVHGVLDGLPGFSARQGEQEVHGVGMAIGWGATRPLLPGPAAPVEEKKQAT